MCKIVELFLERFINIQGWPLKEGLHATFITLWFILASLPKLQQCHCWWGRRQGWVQSALALSLAGERWRECTPQCPAHWGVGPAPPPTAGTGSGLTPTVPCSSVAHP